MAHIIDVIKYEGDNSTLVWKHPCEDFNTKSQLIVHEGQEAVFYMNGQALDLFGPGRYTLDTQNIPILSRMLTHLTGGENAFHCEVYYINKTVQMAQKWGTQSKIHFLEPIYGIPVELGASGEMSLSISDSRKLLVKLIGTMTGTEWGRDEANEADYSVPTDNKENVEDTDKTDLNKKDRFTRSLKALFRPLILSSVRANIPSVIKKEKLDIFDLDDNLDNFSLLIKKSIASGFEEYGLSIRDFYISGLLFTEDNNYRRFRELHSMSLRTGALRAEAELKIAKADNDADVVAAQRKAEIEKKITETEIARIEAERELISAQTEAQKTRLSGLAEAEVMRAQGYDHKDELQAEVQKAYAAGIGNMGANGGGGGMINDFVGLGVGMAAAANISGPMGNMFMGLMPKEAENKAVSESRAKCSSCGAELPENAKFCLECGTKVKPLVEDGMIVCPSCGKTVAKGKFCLECGYRFITLCPKCGTEIAPGAKFCLECGEKL